MTFAEIISTYGLIAAVVGAAACLLTGLVKLPIKKAFSTKKEAKLQELALQYAEAETDEQRQELDTEILQVKVKYDNLFRFVCNLLVVCFAAIGMIIYYAVTVRQWSILWCLGMYEDIFASFAVAKLVWLIYDKLGAKNLLILILEKIRDKAASKNEQVATGVSVIIDILRDDIQLPLTDEQAEAFKQSYEAKINNTK